MNLKCMEHWVINSMTEAKVSLKNGEVPVGSLFIIHKKILDDIVNDNKQKTKLESVSKSDPDYELICEETNNEFDGKMEEGSEEVILNTETTIARSKNNLESYSGAIETELEGKIKSDRAENRLINEETGHMYGERMEQRSEGENSKEATNISLKNDVENYSDAPDKLNVLDNNMLDNNTLDDNASSEYPNTEQHKDDSGGYVIIARGKNEVNATKNATRHAEMVCIDQIVDTYRQTFRKVFENVTVVVNVEPCIMCMAALLDLNVKTIVFTCVNDRFGYNILGNGERTNYFAIEEVDVDCDGSEYESPERRVKVQAGKQDANVEEYLLDVHHDDSISEHKEEIDETRKDKVETSLKNINPMNIENKDEPLAQSKCNKDNSQQAKMSKNYRLSFMNKHSFLKENDMISNKVSSLLGDAQRLNLCNVFHYRKYESDTMNILKLFYKGVNPNAPKNKVKTRK